MKYELKDIFDKHKGKSALIIGHGPSLNNHIKKLTYYRNKGIILFGCNQWLRLAYLHYFRLHTCQIPRLATLVTHHHHAMSKQ